MSPTAARGAGAALIAVVAIWAGMRVYSARTASLTTTVPAGQASPATPADFAASLEDAAAPPVKIPDHLPSFSLNDRLGVPTPIETWAGRSLVLNFWATWCAPCRREIPLLQALQGELAADDVTIVGIAVDHRDEVAAYAQQLKISYPLLVGEQDALDVAAQFGVKSPAFPFTVFTDRRGEVVALYMGELHRAQAGLILGVVRSLNQDRLKLPEARRVIAEGLSGLAAKT
jgi:thiol-disulfide isomerase/thioredoxin